MIGSGKYDKLCATIRKKAKARGAMVIVVGGYYGHGFSLEMTPIDMEGVPEMLRSVASQVENDLKEIKNKLI